jgi:hypothetical protein
MKTLFGRDKYVVICSGIVGFVLVFAFGQQSALAARKAKSKRKVEIRHDMIVMHPTVKLSPADEKAMDDVLKKHAKQLYKIDTVENGKVTTNGSLKETTLTAAVKAEAPTQARGGKSHRTAQVICPAPCNQQNIPPFSTIFKSTSLAERQKLIQELKPILEKYQ